MIAAGFNRVYPWWVRSFGRVHGPFGTSVCPGGWLIIELRDIRVDGAPDIDPGSRVCGSTYAESVREYCEPGPSTSRLIRATPRLNRVQPFPFHVTRPLSSSLSLSFLLASLHSCSPFPRVINHALNSTLSLYRAYTLSELAENLSPPPSSRFVDRHHESVCKSIRYRFHVHTGFFTIELCVKYPEGGAEDSARWIFSGRWPPLLSQLSPGRGGLDVIRYTRALRSIFIFASHAFDRAHRNPWLRFRDKIVFPKINCSRRLGVSQTERAVSRPLVQEAVGSPRTAMMMECRERQTYAKDSCW